MAEEYRQRDIGFLTYPTEGWRAALFKWPVHLWRLGLAPLIGHHMLLLSHTGRKSGLVRRTMLEYFTMDGRKYVTSGFGGRAQWYRNIQANPRVTIQTADGHESAKAVRVSDGETLLRLLDHVRRREEPLYNLYLEALEVEPTDEDILAKKERFYWLTFEVTEEETPPPLPADLVWVWPLAAAGLILLVLLSWIGRRQNED